MGYLSKIWDETLAGPAPEDSALKKELRIKHNSLPATTTTTSLVDAEMITGRTAFMKLRSHSRVVGSSSGSSTGSTGPFSLGELKRLMMQKMAASDEAEHISPTAYEWIVISALDS